MQYAPLVKKLYASNQLICESMAKNLREIYQLKIQLKGIRPPIWRHFLVSNTTSLQELHIACQIVMGWTNSHLHQFIKNNKRFGMVDPEFDVDWDDELSDEEDFKVKDILTFEGDHLLYEYDFGDDWQHKITLEKILPFKTEQQLPNCIKGSRGCPPEDVGGTWGYEEFLEAWLDENHSEHKDMKEWVGDYFHPEKLDVDEINELLNDVLLKAHN